MAQPAPGDHRAIVRPTEGARHFELRRFHPEPLLHRFVDRIWLTRWQLDEPYEQPVVGFPAVNLVIQGGDAAASVAATAAGSGPPAAGAAVVSGVQRVNDRRRLIGRGWALGILFRPGGFRPFVDRPLSSLTDRRIPARDLFGPATDGVVARVLAADDVAEQISAFGQLLLPRVPARPTVGEATRADELARRQGVSIRTLQRLFAEHVGLGPKAVLERCRVQAAADLAHAGPTDWATAAHRLGYADQAHLTSDLSTTYGAPPARYARGESTVDGARSRADPGSWADPDAGM